MGTQILISGGGSTFKLEGTNYLSVLADGTPIENGQAVRDAYGVAQAMNPNGVAASATNRIVILLAPGYYSFNEGVIGDFYIDQSFIDFESLSGVPDVYFSSIQVLSVGAGINVRISGIDTTKNNYYSHGAFAVASQGGASENIIIKNCVGGDYSFTSFSQAFVGTIENCQAGSYSFGYVGNIAPMGVTSVTPGDYTLYGTFKNCTASAYSFISSEVSFTSTVINYGIIDNCTASNASFVYSKSSNVSNAGIISNCRAEAQSFCVAGALSIGYAENSGTIYNCIANGNSFIVGMDSASATNDGRVYDCYISGSGYGFVCTAALNSGINYGSILNCSISGGSGTFCGQLGTNQGIISNCLASDNSFCCNYSTGIVGDIYRCTMINDTFTVGATSGGRVVLGIDTTGVVNY